MASFDRVVAPGNFRRSMNQELFEGSTDGKYKKLVRNRGGLVETELLNKNRSGLSEYYHVQEIPESMEEGPDECNFL